MTALCQSQSLPVYPEKAQVVQRPNAAPVRVMSAAEVREALGRQGFDVAAGSPEEFSRWIRSESEKWARVIRESGAKAD